ncbi:interferon-induced protein 44-like isoform X2 [Polypterus senegalus]|uniref:interferon-induced protein 44-like isoform X2 n=1 Tax=Polypterus senegalus TaxID=55291 RepID=UPI001962D940|nr:interferon-induced protein 44-like isoform X2 [Polypterus senegalus]
MANKPHHRRPSQIAPSQEDGDDSSNTVKVAFKRPFNSVTVFTSSQEAGENCSKFVPMPSKCPCHGLTLFATSQETRDNPRNTVNVASKPSSFTSPCHRPSANPPSQETRDNPRNTVNVASKPSSFTSPCHRPSAIPQHKEVPHDPFLEKPWRNQHFNTFIKDDLLKDIRNYESLTESVEQPRILLVGQIGAGKSSFFNSVNSVFRGHVMLQAATGYGETSVSKQYRIYTVHDGKGGRRLPYTLCDTMGLESSDDDEGIHVEDIISVIKGHVPDMYEFNPKAPITSYDKRYRKYPSLADKVHCVVFVVEADKISFVDQNLLKKFKTIKSEVNRMGIPQLVLITKIDEACQEVYKDLTKVYWSNYLHEKVIQLKQMLGMSVSAVSLVKNYSTETEIDLNVDILLLKALQQMLRAADACFDEMKLKGLTK